MMSWIVYFPLLLLWQFSYDSPKVVFGLFENPYSRIRIHLRIYILLEIMKSSFELGMRKWMVF